MLLRSFEIIKKQPNENSIYNCILKIVESLTTEQLEDRLRDLIKAYKLENIVITNGKMVWKVVWIEYYLRLNLNFRRY